MNTNVLDIIKLMLREAKERNITLGATKLVKLLYLTDVEYYRNHQKKATNLEWRFYHYGPYALELPKLLKESDLEIEDVELEDEKVFKKITENYGDDTPLNLDLSISVVAKSILQQWGQQDLCHILNHVYFTAEPMLDAKKGEILDFSTIKPRASLKEVRISEDTLKKLHERIKQIAQRKSRTRKQVVIHTDYPVKRTDIDECLDIWDMDKKPIKISGKFTISISSLENTESDEK